MTKWHGGKGSRFRSVDRDKFENNWDNIFGKPKRCVKICKSDGEKCIGCGRTLEEIEKAGKGNDTK